jgi:hypothetical protein
VRFQVLTAASMKFKVFWDILTCSQVDVDRRFRGAYCLYHQGGRTWLHGRTSQKTLNFAKLQNDQGRVTPSDMPFVICHENPLFRACCNYVRCMIKTLPVRAKHNYISAASMQTNTLGLGSSRMEVRHVLPWAKQLSVIYENDSYAKTTVGDIIKWGGMGQVGILDEYMCQSVTAACRLSWGKVRAS